MANLSAIIAPTNVVTTTGTQTLTNKTLTGAIVNGTVGATTPSTGEFTTLLARGDSSNATFTSVGQLAIKRSSSDPVLSFHNNTGGQIGNVQFQNDGVCSITVAVNQALVFKTNATERLRIPADAGGITFPASQAASSNANTLDDYEEGTFTPTFSSQGGSITTVSGSGTYTKIGNTVFLWINVTITTVGTATGDCNILGLPFSASQTGAGTGINGSNVVVSVRQSAGTSALFANATNGGSAMANATNYVISINYFV